MKPANEPKILTTLLTWILGLGLLLSASSIQAAESQCAVCGMKVKADSPATFESKRDGKPVHFCSYVCAHSFLEQHPKSPLWVRDFGKGETSTSKKIDAKSAFYLVKSNELEKYLKEEAMPPSVVAFSKKSEAQAFLDRMTEAAVKAGTIKPEDQGKKQDGEIVQKFEEVEKKF